MEPFLALLHTRAILWRPGRVSGAAPVVKSVLLGDGTALVGAPSYDLENGLVHVGTAAGIFYSVQVPLP